ncbi:hypothetical protein [Comamonas guangdongensis]|uniref:Uncharacterized protein n=1 Tax=Comamonas guangdongensis TaxID=510515 RepID=A0ABV3ZVB9_9BURK
MAEFVGKIQGNQSFMSFSGIKLCQDPGHQTINATPYTPSSGVALGAALKSMPLEAARMHFDARFAKPGRQMSVLSSKVARD